MNIIPFSTKKAEQVYLIDSKDLAIALLDLLQLPQKIPNQNQQHKNVKKKKKKEKYLNTNYKAKILTILTKTFGLPELGLGSDLIGGPKLHPVNLRMLIRFGRERPSHNLVLVELHITKIKHHYTSKKTKAERIFHFLEKQTRVLTERLRSEKDLYKAYPESNHF